MLFHKLWATSVVDYGVHHVEHHYLSMYPLGNGIEKDPDPRNNCEVESWLSNGTYQKDNKVWTWFVDETRRIEGGAAPADKSTKIKEKGDEQAVVDKSNMKDAGGGGCTAVGEEKGGKIKGEEQEKTLLCHDEKPPSCSTVVKNEKYS